MQPSLLLIIEKQVGIYIVVLVQRFNIVDTLPKLLKCLVDTSISLTPYLDTLGILIKPDIRNTWSLMGNGIENRTILSDDKPDMAYIVEMEGLTDPAGRRVVSLWHHPCRPFDNLRMFPLLEKRSRLARHLLNNGAHCW